MTTAQVLQQVKETAEKWSQWLQTSALRNSAIMKSREMECWLGGEWSCLRCLLFQDGSYCNCRCADGRHKGTRASVQGESCTRQKYQQQDRRWKPTCPAESRLMAGMVGELFWLLLFSQITGSSPPREQSSTGSDMDLSHMHVDEWLTNSLWITDPRPIYTKSAVAGQHSPLDHLALLITDCVLNYLKVRMTGTWKSGARDWQF